MPCEKHDVSATICVLAACGGQTSQTITTGHFLCSISDVKSSSMFFLEGTKELIFQGNGPNRTIMYSVHLEVETGKLASKAALYFIKVLFNILNFLL